MERSSFHPPLFSSLRKLLSFIFFISILCFTAAETNALVRIPPNETIPAVIVFGDSIVDAGNNNHLKTIIKCNFLPYGINFYGGIPTGRFCDGKVPSDIIAEELGIKEVLPAYLDPNLKPKNLLTGVTFASGGSGYDPLTAKLVPKQSVVSLSDQLTYFMEYIEKLRAIVGEDGTSFVLAKSFFLVVLGTDDIANTYYLLGVRKLQYDINSYTDLVVDYASDFIDKLYGLGARRIGVLGVPAIGCVPFLRTVAGGIERNCAENFNEAAKLFNSKLSRKLDSLSETLPGSKVVYIDIYNPLLDSHP